VRTGLDANGFFLPERATVRAKLDDAAALARNAGAVEFSYLASPSRRGHVFDNELVSMIISLTLGWGRPDNAVDAAKRFLSLIYGSAGELILDAWEATQRAFPASAEGLPADALLDLAFGEWPTAPEAWRAYFGMAWNDVEARRREGEMRVQVIRQRLTRNRRTVDHLDLGLAAVAWLRVQALSLSAAVSAYEEALDGDRPGGLGAVLEALAEIEAGFEPFWERIDHLHGVEGVLAEEREMMAAYAARLRRLRSRVESLRTTAGGALPPPEELGLPVCET
jgi:hypothetical protein